LGEKKDDLSGVAVMRTREKNKKGQYLKDTRRGEARLECFTYDRRSRTVIGGEKLRKKPYKRGKMEGRWGSKNELEAT